MILNRGFLVCSLVAAVFILAGCSHYRLGSGGQPEFSTLYVEPVAVKTMVPQAQTVMSTQLRDSFEKDGRVAITTSREEAQAVLHVTLVSYSREVSSVRPDDTGLARQFALHLRARCTLTERLTGKIYFENREIEATRYAYVDSGQQQAEYQTLPLLAQDLALRIRHTVLDVW